MAAGSWYRVAHCSESKWNVPHGKVLWWEGWSCPLPSAGPWNSVGEGLNSCSRLSGTMSSRLETGQRAVKSRGRSFQMACEPEELHKADTRIKNPQQPRREVKVCASPPDSELHCVMSRAVMMVTMGSVGHQEKPACLSLLRGGVALGKAAIQNCPPQVCCHSSVFRVICFL